jgi:hypothetical protein
MTTTATASSRPEARKLGLKTYRTGRPCRAGHVGERWTSNGCCRECGREHSRQQWELQKKRAAGWIDEHLEFDELDGPLMKAFKASERQRLGID